MSNRFYSDFKNSKKTTLFLEVIAQDKKWGSGTNLLKPVSLFAEDLAACSDNFIS